MKVKFFSAALCLLASTVATTTSAESVEINNVRVDTGQFHLAATQTKIKFRQLKGVRRNGEAIQIDPNSGVKLKMTSKSSAKLSAPGNAKGRKGDVDVYCNCGSTGTANGCNLVKDKRLGDIIAGGVWRCESTDGACGSCKMIMLGGETDMAPKTEFEVGQNKKLSDCQQEA
jgi:hypothetical protein